jgi:hypothetical protein
LGIQKRFADSKMTFSFKGDGTTMAFNLLTSSLMKKFSIFCSNCEN